MLTAKHRTVSWRWRAGFVGVVALVLVFAMAAVALGAPPATGKIKGTVHGYDAAHLAGVRVEVWRVVGWPWQVGYSETFVRSGSTGRNGVYTVSSIPPGDYVVRFTPPDPSRYAFSVYSNKSMLPEGNRVRVLKGRTTSGINAVLANPSTVSGVVRDATTGDPLAGMQVSILGHLPAQFYSAIDTSSAADGTFSVTGLPPGTYWIIAHDPAGWHVETWWDGEYTATAGSELQDVELLMGQAGQVAGTVTAEGDGPLEGILVDSLRWVEGQFGGDGYWEYWWTVQTDAQGVYQIGALAPGAWRFEFSDPEARYALEYYDDAMGPDLATDVDVSAMAVTSGIDAALSGPAGTISGTVTDSRGDPIQGQEVSVWSATVETGWFSVASAQTDSLGHFKTVGLKPGEYRVMFEWSDEYVRETWNNHIDEWVDMGDPVMVTGGADTVCDAQMLRKSHIMGRVTAADGVTPLANEEVAGFMWVDDGWGGWWEWVGDAWTGPDGTYSMSLKQGTYRVAGGVGSASWATEYYDDVYDISSANDITIGIEEDLGGIDFALEVGASISGTVIGPEGQPLEGIEVSVNQWGGDDTGATGGWSVTDANGVYRVGNLHPGDYVVDFWDNSGVYLGEQYTDENPPSDMPDLVSISSFGQSVTGIDAQLARASHIKGTVTGDGVGIWASVEAEQFFEDEWGSWWETVQWADSDSNGAYDLMLAPGDYVVRFSDPQGVYASERYFDKPLFEPGDTIVLGPDETIAGIDADLALGSSISGTVTSAGEPADMVNVNAYVMVGGNPVWCGGAGTDEFGDFTIAGLAPATYRLDFWDDQGRYLYEIYDNVDNWESSTGIDISTPGQNVTGILVDLARSSHIQGTVTDGASALAGIDIEAQRWYDDPNGGGWWETLQWAQTTGDGTYDLVVPPGDYAVRFTDWNPDTGYSSEFYNDKRVWETPDIVSVGQEATVGGIDAVLEAGAKMSGTVTGPDGPVEGIWVNVCKWIDGNPYQVASAPTGPDGTYTVYGIAAPNDYVVNFYDQNNVYVEQIYNGKDRWDQADPVSFTTPGQEVTGIDAVLVKASHITGTVTDGTNPLMWIPVEAQQLRSEPWGDWWESVQWTGTGEDGTYDLSVLPGDYAVQFSQGIGEWVSERWNDRSLWESPDVVAVGIGATASGIDAALAPAGHVVGTVTDQNTGAPLLGINVFARIKIGDDYWGVSSTMTGESGTYDLGGLPSGQYLLTFGDMTGNYLEETWNDHQNWPDGDLVTVTVGGAPPVIDAQLAPASRIEGFVYDAVTGLPVQGCDIWVNRWPDDPQATWWTGWTGAGTDENGFYRIPVPPGLYRLFYANNTPGYVTVQSNGAPRWEEGGVETGFEVGVGQTVTRPDVLLEHGWGISGQVLDDSNNPASNVMVAVLADLGSGWRWVGGTGPDSNGDFQLWGLPYGDYILGFQPAGGGPWIEFFEDTNDPSLATLITVGDHTQEPGGIVAHITP